MNVVSEKGIGKRTKVTEFSPQNRGGKGVKCYKITEKTGNLVGAKSVNLDDEIMMITTEGIIIRIKVNDTALLGRVTSGVKLMNLKDDVVIASIAKVRKDDTILEESQEEVLEETQEEPESDAIQKMLAFLDAETCHEKIRILEDMKDELNEHILNNLAVSLDLSIEEGMDGYQLILSELKMREKYESNRGDRL